MMRDVNARMGFAIGAALVIAGLLAFAPRVPGTNMTHHALHALSGFLLIAAALTGHGRRANQAVGVAYIVLAVVGLLAPALTHLVLGILSGGTMFALLFDAVHAAIGITLVAASLK